MKKLNFESIILPELLRIKDSKSSKIDLIKQRLENKAISVLF